ncbi:hypothetical protein R77560_04634 [Ralstonia thomasii]|uniref:Uncharacterized protein n=1 Tax=Ralstonia thomasii TaxID=3058596 RepID=A0AAD2BUP2_9RALS|nr:hypothetical protein R77560_04634 [Ralstonia sp. LMG 18095]
MVALFRVQGIVLRNRPSEEALLQQRIFIPTSVHTEFGRSFAEVKDSSVPPAAEWLQRSTPIGGLRRRP